MKNSEVLMRAKSLLNAHSTAWIKMKMWSGLPGASAEGGQFCAYGALHAAVTGKNCNDPSGTASRVGHKYLEPAATEVADELGRPLKESVRGSRMGRTWDAAYFNNTAESLDEVNQMFCRAIDKAVEEELREEEKGVVAK